MSPVPPLPLVFGVFPAPILPIESSPIPAIPALGALIIGEHASRPTDRSDERDPLIALKPFVLAHFRRQSHRVGPVRTGEENRQTGKGRRCDATNASGPGSTSPPPSASESCDVGHDEFLGSMLLAVVKDVIELSVSRTHRL